MTVLLATDFHFSDRPKDSYRFGLFDFLIEQVKFHNVELVVILGDLTDEKDKHSAKLVNQIVDGLTRLTEITKVIILKGNHDYFVDPTNPFFKFLDKLKGIAFVSSPQTFITTQGSRLLFLPHFNDESKWDSFKLDKQPDYVFIHQTVTGAISESGRRLDGFSLKPLKRLKAKAVFGGDVHKPHTIDLVTYVGPPYHVRFGDNFTPRCILLNEKTGKTKDIHFDCPRKWSLTITDPEDLLNNKKLRAGDQVKVTLLLTREEVTDWPVFKGRIIKVLADLKLESFGITLKVNKVVKRKGDKDEVVPIKSKSPAEVLDGFCKSERLVKDLINVGKQLLDS